MSYNIINVIKDAVTGKLKFVSKQIRKERLELCNDCFALDTTLQICTACGCFVPAKTKLKDASCPMEKW